MIGSLSIGIIAHAEEDYERMRYKYEIESYFVDLFKSVKAEKSLAFEEEEDISTWQYHAFILRIRPRLGFNIPGMVTLSVVPETEFHWSKNN